ncbi:MAG: type VII secretion protein EssC [Coriobacteriaceae bacterium]|nr:type VII secretion protein EssC [Coriobacteriaceae bacterium]
MSDQAVAAHVSEARRFRIVGFTGEGSWVLGSAAGADVRCALPGASARHARLSLRGELFEIEGLDSSSGTLLNGEPLRTGGAKRLAPGDVVQIEGFTCLIGHRFIVANCRDSVPLEASIPEAVLIDHGSFRDGCPEPGEPDGEERLFYPAPRLMHSPHRSVFIVDGPPPERGRDESPALMQLGPSFVMGLASVFMVASTVSRLLNGADAVTTLPMLAMSVSMIAGTLIWPLISKAYERRRAGREEARRESAYTDYLNAMEHRFQQECSVQAGILAANRVPVPELLDRARTLSPELMNRTGAHSDFLDLRVGVGSAPLEADIRWPSEQFAVDRDRLLSKVIELSHRPPELTGVPLAFNPAEHHVAGILGPRGDVWGFVRGLVVQICSLMSYQDVKIMLVADEGEEGDWGFMRPLPHLFDSAGSGRFLATTPDELMGITMHLERELERHSGACSEQAQDAGPRSVVICANKSLTDPSETIGKLARLRSYQGISLLFIGSELKDLPRECDYVIDLSGAATAETGQEDAAARARMFDRADVSGTMRAFAPDIAVSAPRAELFARDLARVRLDVAGQRAVLPESLGFLEMLRAGNVEQLHIARRWEEADASRTLQAPLGVDAQGAPAILNLHEKVHGPHGLIAGTTGSGKSELIITYVLSMCVSYPPDQAAFVLIDYKGGGLAGAFENDRHRLPHLAGTITNLDGGAINRSLVSIKSELKRRQDALNRAREATGDATMDIYKYLSYYRQGTITEPLPHLFIVADEFAELKQQEPEFMDELISAARIGRSLGVHLILATQKPTGVVNDQIRSNMRFKVCLKVADAADSKEMIGRPDAAEIKGPGRYYLLVGFNEFFSVGQAAYAGAPYVPRPAFAPRIDDAVELIDNAGATVAALRPAPPHLQSGTSEINAVLAGIERAAERRHVRAARLWLDPLPESIELADLEHRYGFIAHRDVLDPAIGEVDDPATQRKHLLTLPLSQGGNAVVYGAAESGAESVLATALAGLIAHHGPDELNVYAIDLGSEGLTAFADAPQVGGVVRGGEDERVRRLIAFLEAEVRARRTALVEYGGFARYCEQVEDHRPAIVVVINNMAAFYELYESYEPRLVSITREGPGAGVLFMVSAPSTVSLRMRLRANFKQELVVQFNDENDYVSVFGSMRGTVLPRGYGRGLVKTEDGVREYQAAHVGADGGGEYAFIRKLSRALADAAATEAPPIPSLPERLPFSDIRAGLSASALPYGIYEESLALASFDLDEQVISRVLYAKTGQMAKFVGAWAAGLARSAGTRVLVLDAVGSLACGVAHVTGQEEVVEHLAQVIGDGDASEGLLVCIVVGLAPALQRLAPDAAARIKDGLRSLAPEDGVRLVLVDNAGAAASYVQHDWFREQSSVKDALWVGSGIAPQAALSLGYAGKQPETKMADDQGYEIASGVPVLVKLVSGDAGCEGAPAVSRGRCDV